MSGLLVLTLADHIRKETDMTEDMKQRVARIAHLIPSTTPSGDATFYVPFALWADMSGECSQCGRDGIWMELHRGADGKYTERITWCDHCTKLEGKQDDIIGTEIPAIIESVIADIGNRLELISQVHDIPDISLSFDEDGNIRVAIRDAVTSAVRRTR